VRVKIDYSGGYSVLAPRIFARYAEGRVANPNDCVVFFKQGGKYQAGGGPMTQASIKSAAARSKHGGT